MALAINIYYLLNKKKIESNRIEFKKGWNPYYCCLFFCTSVSLQPTFTIKNMQPLTVFSN